MPPAHLRRISKRVFLASLNCPTAGWFALRPEFDQDDIGTDPVLIAEGRRVGAAARRLYSGGILVSSPSPDAAVTETKQLIADSRIDTIYEAAFVAEPYVARADILKRARNRWHLLEVKASLDSHDEHLDDLAYTAFVMARAGIRPVRASLLLLNRDYRLGQPAARLFAAPIDLTSEVCERIEQWGTAARAMPRRLLSADKPPPRLTKACAGCPYFTGHCLGAGVNHHVLDLPRLSAKAIDQLRRRRVHSIIGLPDDLELTPAQSVVRRAVLRGRPQRGLRRLGEELGKINWPAAYLDFETIHTAIPRFPDTAPYEQVPTQFSLHICEEPGSVSGHFDFLVSPGRDGRRELIERLVEHTEDAKSIVVFGSFEKTILRSLASRFPDLARDIESCVERLYDLNRAFQPMVYYHPEFHGSSSIKQVLPALIPELSYDDLTIGDGATAMAMYLKVLDGDCTDDEAAAIRRDLLAYCKLDTLAMVKLHAKLAAVRTEATKVNGRLRRSHRQRSTPA